MLLSRFLLRRLRHSFLYKSSRLPSLSLDFKHMTLRTSTVRRGVAWHSVGSLKNKIFHRPTNPIFQEHADTRHNNLLARPTSAQLVQSAQKGGEVFRTSHTARPSGICPRSRGLGWQKLESDVVVLHHVGLVDQRNPCQDIPQNWEEAQARNP